MMKRLFTLCLLFFLTNPTYADRYYLQPDGDITQYSDAADYPAKPDDRPGFVWMQGFPPQDAKPYHQPTLLEQLQGVFQQLTPDQRAAFGPIAAYVKMAIEQGDLAGAKAAIQAVNTADPTLQAVKEQLLEAFP